MGVNFAESLGAPGAESPGLDLVRAFAPMPILVADTGMGQLGPVEPNVGGTKPSTTADLKPAIAAAAPWAIPVVVLLAALALVYFAAKAR